MEGLRFLAELAEISLPQPREDALAAGMELSRRTAEMLARQDYGETEPAGSFRLPRGER